jgi:hypothetical protein
LPLIIRKIDGEAIAASSKNFLDDNTFHKSALQPTDGVSPMEQQLQLSEDKNNISLMSRAQRGFFILRK